ncbi:TetR/AcrR family transcriptional regulator [Thermosyntropha sp.]|uniref:TetR/AcrR family transcriptional regulator n=1 Tax=Thermosyntropha sp. TaxID=2740820 RepID=UPI0025F571C4|nr:TetR/AcrR family transcriptional regulator [Thermosyntropha sp.]MBO8159619.1 TetR/AcrR family transcriptional regulator [Thermosyntropha sp.]
MKEEEAKFVEGNREKILDAATRLVMEKGVKGTSLADIAREAGISKGTLFYYFPSKDELIYELTVKHFDQMLKGFLDRISYVEGENPEEVIREGLMLILNAEKRDKLNLYLLQEAFMGNEILKKRFRDTYAGYRQIMQTFLARIAGRKSESDWEVEAVVLVALADGLIIQWLMHPEIVDVKKIARLIVQGFLKG